MAERRELIAALPDNAEDLRGYLESCANLLEEHRETRQSIEARLTTIMGLSSIAGTVVFSGILALGTGAVRPLDAVLRWTMAVGALYLALQLCNAILWAVLGLWRRRYSALTTSDILPKPGEASVVSLRRRIATYLKVEHQHQRQTSTKVTYMAVAHRAIFNFLAGLVVLATVGVLFGVKVRPRSDDVVEALRQNRMLQDVLRGPPGPRGEVGPKGEPCKEALSRSGGTSSKMK